MMGALARRMKQELQQPAAHKTERLQRAQVSALDQQLQGVERSRDENRRKQQLAEQQLKATRLAQQQNAARLRDLRSALADDGIDDV